MIKRYRFTKEELKDIKILAETKDVKEALERWADYEFDLKHNGSLTTGKIGKTFIDIIELP